MTPRSLPHSHVLHEFVAALRTIEPGFREEIGSRHEPPAQAGEIGSYKGLRESSGDAGPPWTDTSYLVNRTCVTQTHAADLEAGRRRTPKVLAPSAEGGPHGCYGAIASGSSDLK
jgi:hypothetical protein